MAATETYSWVMVIATVIMIALLNWFVVQTTAVQNSDILVDFGSMVTIAVPQKLAERNTLT